MDCRDCGHFMQKVRDGSWICPLCEPEKTLATHRVRPVGRERSFATVVILTIVTLGIYFLYYQYVVFWDVDHAAGRKHHWPLYAAHVAFLIIFVVSAGWLILTSPFEAHETFRHPPWLRILALAGAPFHAAYLFLELRRFKGPWEAPMQLPWFLPALILLQAVLGQTPPGSLGFLSLSVILFVIQIILFWMMNTSINAWWRERWSEQTDDDAETGPRTSPA